MGAAESHHTESRVGEDPFANVKVVKACPPAAEELERQREQELANKQTKHKSPAQLKQEEDAKAKLKGWVYKNERRATPAEIRRTSRLSSPGTFQDPPSPKGPSSPKAPSSPKGAGSRRAQSARPGTTLIDQIEGLRKEEAQTTREQKLEREKDHFMQRVSTFMAGNVAIRPTSSAGSNCSSLKLPIVPPVKGVVPGEYQEAWMQKLLANREEILQALKNRADMDHSIEPKTEDDVREGVARSLGSTYDVFTTFQRTINRTLAAGLNEELLQQLLLNDKGRGSQDQQSLQQDWRAVGAAVEGVMQVYINRSNSRFITNGDWVQPRIVDGHGTLAHVYSHGAETMVAQSMVALLYIDTGHLVKVGDADNSLAAVLSTDLWQAIKKLLPNKVPSSQRLERVSLLGRHLLQAAISTESQHGKYALSKLKVILAVDQEQEIFTVTELRQWHFFGLNHQNVVVLPMPRFPGFAQDDDDVLRPVEGSPKVLHGAGYAVCLLQAPCAGYTLDETASRPTFLPGSILDWLKEGGVRWLYSGMFYDAGRAQVFDNDFLAGALYASEREGANMAVQVIKGREKQEVRTYDSVLLGRRAQDGGTVYTCDLCPSSMRTVRSYQVLQAQLEEGFHISTHRYLYKVSALSKILRDSSSIPLDLILHGYYAYGTTKLNSITCAPEACCAAVACMAPPGPPMEHAVLGLPWLEQAASRMAAQDKVDAFRQKAISLVDQDQLPLSLVTGLPHDVKRLQHTQPRRLLTTAACLALKNSRSTSCPGNLPLCCPLLGKSRGQVVLLLMSLEHRGQVAKAAYNLARLAVRNIVDQLHVLVIKNIADSESLVDEMLKELFDKEADYNGQLHKSWVEREPDHKTADLVLESIEALDASLIVVPDVELGEGTKAAASAAVGKAPPLKNGHASRPQSGWASRPQSAAAAPAPPSGAGHAASHSLALLVAKTVTKIPVLVVKHNSSGRFAFGGHQTGLTRTVDNHHPVHIIVHLESLAVSLMVEYACRFLTFSNDVLLLAKTKAFDRPGQPSMRTNRMIVQAKMAANGPMRVEERMYLGKPVPELCQAAETELSDIVMVSTAGEMPISKETEELLLTAKSSVLIYRNKELTTCAQDSLPIHIVGEVDVLE